MAGRNKYLSFIDLCDPSRCMGISSPMARGIKVFKNSNRTEYAKISESDISDSKIN